MARYRLHEKLLSLTLHMTIDEDEGGPRFRVEGNWRGAGVTLTDLADGSVLSLRQEARWLTIRWHIEREGVVLATLEKEGLLGTTFLLDVPGPNDFVIEQPSWTSLDLRFRRSEHGEVARAYAEGWTAREVVIDIEDGQDEPLIVACTAILLLMRRG